MLNYQQLKEILPQASPFLLIDRVEEYKEVEHLVAVKNVTRNEWPLSGYSQDTDVFPQVLLIEAAAQAALVLYYLSRVKNGPQPRYVLGRANSEFFNDVKAGDQIRFQVSAGKMLDFGGYSSVQVSRGEEKISQVEIFYSVSKVRYG